MPELPEVEYARRLLARFLTHTYITKVSYPDVDGLAKRFLNCTPNSFADGLVNRKILDIKRHGKYLWFEMADQKPLTPIFHFGMSGGFRIKSAPDVTYLKELEHVKRKAKNEVDGQCESFVYDDELDADLTWPPRFTRIRLLTSTGHDVCYTDLRKFGRFHLIESNEPLSCIPLSKLGFDPYLEMPKLNDFKDLIDSYRSKSIELKALLLDQSFCAGIGNWIADEILYQSHLHPRKRLNTLTNDQLKSLYKNIDYVIRTAVDAGGSHKFPPEWLFHFRWTNKRETEDYYKLKIRFDTVGGRTSAYVPQRQLLSDDEQHQVDARLAARDAKRASKKKMGKNDDNTSDDQGNENSVTAVRSKGLRKKRSKQEMVESDSEKEENAEVLANKLFDLFSVNGTSNQIDFIHFIRLWNILWNGDFRDKLIILFLAHLENVRTREEGFSIIFEPIPIRSASMISESRSIDLLSSTREQQQQLPSFKVENAEVTHLKPSQLPLMTQTEFIHLCKSLYNLMTGANDDEDLFKALTTSSTILLQMGEMCKPYRLIEIDDTPVAEWTVSFEQFEATMMAESCLVSWFENSNTQSLSLEQRINNYHQDILR